MLKYVAVLVGVSACVLRNCRKKFSVQNVVQSSIMVSNWKRLLRSFSVIMASAPNARRNLSLIRSGSK
jgi:hypothetical protein